MAELKGNEVFLITGKGFESYFSELIRDFVLEEGSMSRPFDIDSVYEDFKRFVIEDADRIFKERRYPAIVVKFKNTRAKVALNAEHLFGLAEWRYGKWNIKRMLEEAFSSDEGF